MQTVTGGLDTGVMQFVGDAVKKQDFDDVPCIGIATHKKVSHFETLAVCTSCNSI